jgi:serine/threonine protein kinase
LKIADEEEEVLGHGGFGEALFCLHIRKNVHCVVKRIPKIPSQGTETESAHNTLWKQEVEAMSAVASPYILKIFDAFEEKCYRYIVTEYCENGNLRNFLIRCERGGNFLSTDVSSTFSMLLRFTYWMNC